MGSLTGEGARKYDLIRWNLLAEKIKEMKQTYLQELADGTYQKTIYFNYADAAHKTIDMSSVTWNGLPDNKTAKFPTMMPASIRLATVMPARSVIPRFIPTCLQSRVVWCRRR